VGTGTGILVPFLLEKIGSDGRLVCLDYAEKMLGIAQYKQFKGNISFICADIENSGLPGDSFDAVVCYSSFPHFRDKPRALGEIYRVLKQDCRLFICHTSSRPAINKIHRSLPEVRDHVFPENSVTRRMLATAGFEDISISDGRDSYFISASKPGDS
jgi:demethylmenaquinone methyltransferase/2-methoxy-6-polyprenyl-1,4-benzoquinol methylase